MRDPTDTQQAERDAEAERLQAERKRKQETEDLAWLMAHAQGRRIVARIFEKTGTRRTPFNTSGSVMSFKAGEQNIGLWLEAEILETSFEGYVTMLKEFAQ